MQLNNENWTPYATCYYNIENLIARNLWFLDYDETLENLLL